MKKLLMVFVFVTGMAFLNNSIASELIPMQIIKEDGVGNGQSIYSFLTTVVFFTFSCTNQETLDTNPQLSINRMALRGALSRING